MSNVIKQSAKLVGISSLLLLLVLPSLSMAEITINYDTMTASGDVFIFEAGHMRLKFGDGYIEIWFDPSFGTGLLDGFSYDCFEWWANGRLLSWRYDWQ
jgi:hypothetical protein